MDVARHFAAAFALLISTGWSAEAAAQTSARPVQTQENCTRAVPCTGPQGGVYFITPSGTRSYMPRSEAPPVRVQVWIPTMSAACSEAKSTTDSDVMSAGHSD
jgi:hypothetical protein